MQQAWKAEFIGFRRDIKMRFIGLICNSTYCVAIYMIDKHEFSSVI